VEVSPRTACSNHCLVTGREIEERLRRWGAKRRQRMPGNARTPINGGFSTCFFRPDELSWLWWAGAGTRCALAALTLQEVVGRRSSPRQCRVLARRPCCARYPPPYESVSI